MKKRKFNVVDLVVILAIVFLIFGGIYKFGMLNKNAGEGASDVVPISYSVIIEKVREFSLENIEVGDVLYDKTSGNSIGVITDITSTVAKDIVEKNDGTALLGEVENRIDIILTVEGEGIITESGHFVNKTYELLVGSDKKFYTKYIECSGSVKEIF